MSDEKKAKKPEIAFHFQKTANFRVVWADGVFGGVTPSGHLDMVFYSERYPLPKQLVYELRDDGTLGSEIGEKRVAKDGVVRDAELSVQLSLGTAKSLMKWLGQKIEMAEALQSAAQGSPEDDEDTH